MLGSAASLIYDVPAENSELSIIPASIRFATPSPLALLAMSMASKTVSMLNIKALNVIMPLDAPISMAKAAPNAAPELAPSISGEAIGFLNTP